MIEIGSDVATRGVDRSLSRAGRDQVDIMGSMGGPRVWFGGWLGRARVTLLGLLLALLPGAISRAVASEPVGAGGLVFAIQPGVVVESVDIAVTAERIRYVYAVRNKGRTPKAVLVTFAMPEVDRYSLAEQGGYSVLSDALNIVGATTTVDGQTIDLRAQQRAYALGLDVTGQIAQARLSLLPLDPKLDLQISQLSPAVSADLIERGILQIDDGRARPGWILETTAYWRQMIPAGAAITIEHAYTPLTGIQVMTEQAIQTAVERACLSAERAADLKRRLAKPNPPTLMALSLLQSTVSGQEPPLVTELRIELPDDGLDAAVCLEPLIRSGPRTLSWRVRQGQLERDLIVMLVRGSPGN